MSLDVTAVKKAIALWDDILTHHAGSDLAYHTVLDAARLWVEQQEAEDIALWVTCGTFPPCYHTGITYR